MTNQRKIIRYSESFKREIVESIESGDHTISSAQRHYGIKGGSTIKHWIKKFGKLDLLPKQIRIEMPGEKSEQASLKAEIKRLQAALVETQLKHLESEAYLEVALEELGEEDKASFKKKVSIDKNRFKKQ